MFFKSCILPSILVASSLVGIDASARPLQPKEAERLSHTEVIANLQDSHPSTYYEYAVRVFGEGDKDKAVMWFYVGQLRYRYHLAANPDLPASGDPSLLASLNETVGRLMNQWAGGSPRDWTKSIDAALEWDLVNKNNYTPKEKHIKELTKTREGLKSLRESIIQNAESIRAQRKKAGLENR
jgi:hypothetical protein